MSIKEKTIALIDDLKATCQSYGLGNDGNEYKIITQVFMYKFLNDKFGYELKRSKSPLVRQLLEADYWETAYSEMSDTERQMLLMPLPPEILRLEPEHLLFSLWNKQSTSNFDEIFDATMTDIAEKNIEIFSTQTTQNTKIPLFERLTSYVTDLDQRPAFARALVDKLVNFSFEEAFVEHEGYDFFATIFESLIKDYNTAGGGKYAEYYTPHAIAMIMAKLLVGDGEDLHDVEVYDPSAGTGTLLMALAHRIGNEKCTVFSQDISQRSNKLIKLNLLLNGLVSSLDHAIQGDTLVSPYHKNDEGTAIRQFDYVVSNPPFKMDFSETREKIASQPSRFWAGVPKVPAKKKEGMAIYTCFIQHVINSLKKEGKGAIVIPTGFITAKNGIENKILKHIVDKKIVYGVVSMPSNVFANTGTNVSVLFFDNSRSHDKVVLVDASKLGKEYKEGNNLKKRLLPEEITKIIDIFQERKSEDDFSVVVSHEEIKEKGYSLSAGHYFTIKIEHIDITEEEFKERMKKFSSELKKLFFESDRLGKEILQNLEELHLK